MRLNLILLALFLCALLGGALSQTCDGGCSGSTPICQDGSCVACNDPTVEDSNAACSDLNEGDECATDGTCFTPEPEPECDVDNPCTEAGFPICQDGSCVACNDPAVEDSDAACSLRTLGHVCQTDSGRCVECVTSSHCADIGDTPFCSDVSWTCVECDAGTNEGCHDDLETCSADGSCVPTSECSSRDTSACGESQVCNLDTGVCVDCVTSTDCAGKLVCFTGEFICTECSPEEDQNCFGDQVCGEDGVCVHPPGHPCDSHSCTGASSCVASSGVAECVCDPGFAGAACEPIRPQSTSEIPVGQRLVKLTVTFELLDLETGGECRDLETVFDSNIKDAVNDACIGCQNPSSWLGDGYEHTLNGDGNGCVYTIPIEALVFPQDVETFKSIFQSSGYLLSLASLQDLIEDIVYVREASDVPANVFGTISSTPAEVQSNPADDTPPTPVDDDDDDGLSDGAKAGIALGVIFFVAAVCGILLFFYAGREKQDSAGAQDDQFTGQQQQVEMGNATLDQQQHTQQPQDTQSTICMRDGCNNQFALICPLCHNEGRPEFRICSQECLNEAWSGPQGHGLTHS